VVRVFGRAVLGKGQPGIGPVMQSNPDVRVLTGWRQRGRGGWGVAKAYRGLGVGLEGRASGLGQKIG